MSMFLHKDYSRKREKVMAAYVDNMVAHLMRMTPGQDINKVTDFVKKTVTSNLKRPKLKQIAYPSYGNANLEDVDLLDHTYRIADKIITPSGSVYKTPDELESIITTRIVYNIKRRKVVKKVMLDAQARGDIITEQRANYQQSNIKINNNSISGAQGSPFNCLFDISGYNSITSTSRHSIMGGYSHTERLLEGNHYFPTIDHVINYCTVLLRVMPDNVMDVVARHNMHIPSVDDVFDYFADSLKYYMYVNSVRDRLIAYICTMTETERTFVFYALCLKNIIQVNDAYFRKFFKVFFSTDYPTNTSLAPKEVFGINADLLAMVTSLNSELIKNEDGLSVHELTDKMPEAVQRITTIAKHMEMCLSSIADIIETFIRIDMDTPDVMSHPRMIRRAVIVSDTDSVIFTTKSWIFWRSGELSFEKESYEINAFVVAMLTMSLEHVFARLSVGFGIRGDDVYKIAMKNEFLYPLMLRTPGAKHYVGKITIQEGKILPKPKLDIKGVNLRGSALSKETNDATEEFALWLINRVESTKTISGLECINKVLEREHLVARSLQSGDKTFLKTIPIKTENDYKNSNSSNYFYYQLWDEVFSAKFGQFDIPNKGYILPIVGKGAGIRDHRFLDTLKVYDNEMYIRLLKFFNNNTRKITIIVIPPTLLDIPEILRPLIDIQKIVFTNTAPFYLLLRSLGLGVSDGKVGTTLSDMYNVHV